MKKKIWIVTGSRAEYGLLKPLIKRIKNAGRYKLEILVTGQHLATPYGLTFKEIEKDGFRISKKIKMLWPGDSELSIARSVGSGIAKFGELFSKEHPDLLIVLGDRFEIFAAATAAFIFKIPIAHLHGGEITSASMDDTFRHAITKMSILHFVSNPEYKKRVVQLGEQSQRVFSVGAIGIDSIKKAKLLSKFELQKELGFKFGEKNILVTFHPATLETDTVSSQFKELLAALDNFKNSKIIFTHPNSDVGSLEISRMIDDYVKRNSHKAKAFVSLGTVRYFSLIKSVDVVLGNSSSGIIEVPSFKKPTVNIGDRQKGRIMASSVINCKPNRSSIYGALRKALSEDFKKLSRKTKNPYGDGKTTERIIRIIGRNIDHINNTTKIFEDIQNV